ncbi:MAG TPA: tRNA lysidine(34) synthetase TilS [Thermoanaerobaculia bacterium]|nr:tRNA lysidine(34) synthetase TilS [Thermoanaerobaculia bacterium]
MESEPVLEALANAASSGLMPRGATVLLAVSGGADSMALLHGASELAPRNVWRLVVGHVHHGLRGRDADRDLAFVAAHAQRLDLSFRSCRCDAARVARQLKLSPESAARHARYSALREIAKEAGAQRIATAHQRDDRVESFRIARERRAGTAGLGGPRRRRSDGVVRPLLAVSREEILTYLRRRGITHRRDASNGDLRLTRNRVRRELARLPMKDREPIIAELERQADLSENLRADTERTFEEWLRPRISFGPGSVAADADLLSRAAPDVARKAIEEIARPFAAPGCAPLTGPEREQIRRRLADGLDFRFEARRRILFERRAGLLTVRPARTAAGKSV